MSLVNFDSVGMKFFPNISWVKKYPRATSKGFRAGKSKYGRVQNSKGTKYELTICNGYGCKGGAGVCSRTKFILKGIIIFPINCSLKQVNKRSTRCP